MRLRKKQGLRIVSSVLAASMALSVFPTAAFAADTDGTSNAGNSAVVAAGTEETKETLEIVNGKPTSYGNETSGWTYECDKDDDGNITWDKLTLYEGYEFNQDVEVDCRVENYGTITAGTFKEWVNNAGEITNGVFAGGVSNYIYTYSSDEGNKRIEGAITGGVFSHISGNEPENTRTLTAINSTINGAISDGAYIVGENQKVTVTYNGDDEEFESWKVIDGISISDLTAKTIEFTMPANDVFMRVVYKDRPLVIGEDGEPTCNGGKNWEYRDEDTSYKELFLYDGCEFAPENTVTCMVVVYPGATIQSGTFDAPVVNLGTIKSGTFNHEVRSAGVIENGTFNNEVDNITLDGTAMGGEYTEISKCEGAIKDGTFNKTVANGSKIEGGTFKGRVTNVTVSGEDTEDAADMIGEISGGTFEDTVINFSTIKNGTFNETVETAGTILDGNFNARVQNANVKLDSEVSLDEIFRNSGVSDDALGAMIKDCAGLISGGTFNGTVDNAGMIEGGEFKEIVTNRSLKEFVGEELDEMGLTYTNTTEISDGTFWAEVQNYAEITGGDFKKKVTNVGTIKNGGFWGDVANTTSSQTSDTESDASNETYTGSITGGAFWGQVTNNGGSVTGGVFRLAPKGDSVANLYKLSAENSSIGTASANHHGNTHVVWDDGSAYVAGKYEVYVSYKGEAEFGSWKTDDVDLSTAVTSKSVRFPMPGDKDVTLTASAEKPTEITVNKDTKLDTDQAYDTNIKNEGTISKGEFTGEVTNNNTIENGTFQNTVTNEGTIKNGSFEDTVTNNGTIEDGKFAGEVKGTGIINGGTFQQVTEAAVINGGVFGVQSNLEKATVTPSTLKIESGVADGSTVNDIIGSANAVAAMALFEENDIAAQAEDPAETVAFVVGEQTLTVKYAGSDENFDKWDTTGLKDASLSEDGKTVTFTMDSDITLKAIQKNTDTKPVEPDQPDSGNTDTPSTDKPDSGNTDTPSTDKPDSGSTDTPSTDKTDTDKPNTENPANNDSGAGALVVGGILVAGGVATGMLVYNVAMDYIKSALPEGAEIPETREQLAVALWENAGKPEVAVEEGVELTDTQKAVRWAVEKQIVSAEGEETLSKLDVLIAVYRAKKL